jgi:flagellin-specific chaperone FliS
MIAQLAEANLSKKIEPIQVVRSLLEPIRDAWAQMLAQSNSVAA